MPNRRKISTIIALLIAVGLFSAASATGSAGSTLILDKFDEKKATALVDHTPNDDNTGIVDNGWFIENNDGNWEAKKGKAKELSTVPRLDSNDYRALIDSDYSDVSASVKVKIYQDGDQLWGVVARWSGDHDWLMAFHDGVGALILGKKVFNEDKDGHYADPDIDGSGAGGFQELKRVPMDWSAGKKGKTHTIKIITEGSDITVLADGDSVITEQDHGDMSSTIVGMFSRGTGKNQFDEFKVETVALEAAAAEEAGKGKKGKKK
jgi:hypothetical protein